MRRIEIFVCIYLQAAAVEESGPGHVYPAAFAEVKVARARSTVRRPPALPTTARTTLLMASRLWKVIFSQRRIGDETINESHCLERAL